MKWALGKFAVGDDAGIVEIMQFPSGGPIDCCTKMAHHGFAGIRKNNYSGADLVGVKANFTTKYGAFLCGTPSDTIYTFSLVWLEVGYDTTLGVNGYVWAQAGFGKHRIAGLNTVWQARFHEVHRGVAGDLVDRMIDINNSGIPPDGEIHEFKEEFDLSSQRWIVYYDGSAYDTAVAIPFWQSVRGSYSRYGGEVRHLEDDMAGTASSPCRIFDCTTKSVGGIYNTVTFRLSSSFQWENRSQWMADTADANTVLIWDVHPR
ncbi:MAG: hypothetical protein AB1644_07465 [Candidatus Zixiibacteriota bacterium]